jgi:hypothetical protein
VYGDRWSLDYEGRALQTCGTELEARRYAREMGWIAEAPPVPD